jgi:hypothetical protein
VKTIVLPRKVYNGTRAMVGWRPLTRLPWQHPPFVLVTMPNEGERIETPCEVPLMPFLSHCAHCSSLITMEDRSIINGAN